MIARELRNKTATTDRPPEDWRCQALRRVYAVWPNSSDVASLGLATRILGHPPVAREALPPAEHSFDPAPQPDQQPVDSLGGRAQLLPAAGFAPNPVGYAPPAAPFTALAALTRFVGHDHCVAATHHHSKFPAARRVGDRQGDFPNQRVLLVHRRERLVAVMRHSALDGEAGLCVATNFILFGRRPAGGLRQRRVHQRAGFQVQGLLFQLAVDTPQQLFIQAVLDDTIEARIMEGRGNICLQI